MRTINASPSPANVTSGTRFKSALLSPLTLGCYNWGRRRRICNVRSRFCLPAFLLHLPPSEEKQRLHWKRIDLTAAPSVTSSTMADSVGEQANGSVGTAHSLGNSVLGHSSASPPPADTGLVEPSVPVVAVPPSLSASIVSGVPAGAGLLSQIHATSWDPTLSTDWDNEKASQQCILRIKRLT